MVSRVAPPELADEDNASVESGLDRGRATTVAAIRARLPTGFGWLTPRGDAATARWMKSVMNQQSEIRRDVVRTMRSAAAATNILLAAAECLSSFNRRRHVPPSWPGQAGPGSTFNPHSLNAGTGSHRLRTSRSDATRRRQRMSCVWSRPKTAHRWTASTVIWLLARYGHAMLIDGNDPRGIDVGILTTPQIEIVARRSNVDTPDSASGEHLFSRDCRGSSSALTRGSGRVGRDVGRRAGRHRYASGNGGRRRAGLSPAHRVGTAPTGGRRVRRARSTSSDLRRSRPQALGYWGGGRSPSRVVVTRRLTAALEGSVLAAARACRQ